MSKRLGLLIAGSLAFWLLVVFPADMWGGRQAVVYSATALVLCLAPTVITLVVSELALKSLPDQQWLAVLAGTAVRMTVVLGVGLLLSLSGPYFRRASFWIWILVCYLVTLTLEIGLLLRTRSATGNL